MLSRSSIPVGSLQLQQVRYMSGRRIAYPFYPFRRLPRQHPKSHDTNLKSAMRQFLGPKNFKGEYPMNKYSKIPSDHVPNYIRPDLERGQSLETVGKEPLKMRHDGTYEIDSVLANQRVLPKRRIQPFPGNKHCVTNFIIDDELKSNIYNEITNLGMSTQQVSQKYGIKIPRVEAIVKLQEVEQQWLKDNLIKEDTKVMAGTLFKMFPVYQPDASLDVNESKEFRRQGENYMEIRTRRENLSEIPVPPKALRSRFLTISESEPFGPLDAAKVLELEPAMTTLEKLASVGEHSTGHTNKIKKTKVIYGELLQGEKSQFKFKEAKVGHVGFRYGAGNRDSKKDRRIDFDEQGKMVYV